MLVTGANRYDLVFSLLFSHFVNLVRVSKVEEKVLQSTRIVSLQGYNEKQNSAQYN